MARKKITLSKLRRRNRRFYTVYTLCLAVFALIALAACLLARDWLAEYESAQPVHEAEKIARLFTSRDFAAIYPWEDADYLDGADMEEYVAFMNENTAGMDITWRKKITADTSTVTYAVYADGKRFGSFVLSPAGQTRHGVTLWAVSSISTSIFLHEEPPEPVYGKIRVRCDSRSQVAVNGLALDASSIVESGIATGASSHMPRGVAAPTDVIYETDAAGEVSISVTDYLGRDQAVSLQGGVYVAAVNYDDDQMRESREGWIVQLAQAVTRYTTRNLSMNTLLRRVEENSKAHQYLSGIDLNYTKVNKGIEFTESNTRNYLAYSDECFSCEVYYRYVIHYYEADKAEQAAYRFYFRRANNLWMLYDFETLMYQE